ncbi:MAG: NAD(P)H-dependent oxidoreductase subunit E [Candidatus Brocadiae bacterium]|nr:NAD(P)H-dependent oxidoreductase subunit E [Candidatus Brocadiia bacterium]
MTKVEEILKAYPQNETSLIMVLQDIHDTFHYLPCDALKKVAQELQVPFSKVFSVTTFYKAFSLNPKGKKIIRVCLGTACHIRGGSEIIQEFERQLGILRSQTTQNQEFTLETVNCVGACAMAPVVVVNEEYHRSVTTIKVKDILKGEKNED